MSDPKPNQQVIIINGTYDGLIGDVVSDNPGPSRTYLLVVHIAGLGDVQVPNWQVEPTALNPIWHWNLAGYLQTK